MSVVECIHGLEGAQCAICFPKPDPVAPAKEAPSRTGSKAAAGPRRSPRVAGGASAAARAQSPLKGPADITTQRLYHVTHLSNLPQIIASGRLLADASGARAERPAFDISSDETRDARRNRQVTGPTPTSIAHYVPFFLSPNANVWESIRAGVEDPRLSAAAHASSSYDYVILVSTIRDAFEAHPADGSPASVIATDGDAAGTLTRFGASRESSERMLRSLRADDEDATILQAEVLVHDQLPFERITLIGVVNDRMRAAVRRVLASAEHRPKVAVYPPWFQPGSSE